MTKVKLTMKSLLIVISTVLLATHAKSHGGNAQVHMGISNDEKIVADSSKSRLHRSKEQQDQDKSKYMAFLEEEERARKILTKNAVM